MRIGVDLGGTKIEVIAIDEAGATIVRRRLPTPAGEYARILRTIAILVRDAEREAGASGSVGIGTPGAVSRANSAIKNSNSTVLIGKPFARDIAQSLQREVRIANDANCLALSEAADGAAAGARVVFGVILGTGVGGGIAVDRGVLEGANGIAGEWGHIPLPWPREDELPGPQCYCGKFGCIETFLSGPSLAQQYEARTGRALQTAAVADAASAGDPDAADCLERYEDRLARGLAVVIDILDPNVIVLGGGLSNVARLYENVPRLLPRYIFSDGAETKIVRAAHGDSSGVRGAAMLWPTTGRD